jgi:hypothetical protein
MERTLWNAEHFGPAQERPSREELIVLKEKRLGPSLDKVSGEEGGLENGLARRARWLREAQQREPEIGGAASGVLNFDLQS